MVFYLGNFLVLFVAATLVSMFLSAMTVPYWLYVMLMLFLGFFWPYPIFGPIDDLEDK